MRAARDTVEEFRTVRERGLPAEIVSVHLRDAAFALEELLAIVDQEDVLDVLFSSFCVGK